MSLNTRSKFMMIVAVGFFIFAMLWGLAPYASINFPARLILDILDWPMSNLSAPLDRNTQWLSAISAGLMCAISVLLGGIVVPAIKERNLQIVNTTTVAILVWYLIDSFGSYASGVISNVFFNTLFLVLVLAPLIGVKHAKEH